MTFPILSVLILLPLAGAVWVLLAPGNDGARAVNARMTALVVTAIEFVLGVGLWLGFDQGSPGFQFVERVDLFAPFLSWHLGIDGIALMLIMLSVFLMPLCILASWQDRRSACPNIWRRSC